MDYVNNYIYNYVGMSPRLIGRDKIPLNILYTNVVRSGIIYYYINKSIIPIVQSSLF